MKFLRILLFSILIIGLTFSIAAAGKHTPQERGKALFNDPKFAGGSKSCNECHMNGKGLEKAGAKKEFTIMNKKLNSIEDAVNFCIEKANKGKPIDVKSQQMKDIVSYIETFTPR